jgi:hypothetical protein
MTNLLLNKKLQKRPKQSFSELLAVVSSWKKFAQRKNHFVFDLITKRERRNLDKITFKQNVYAIKDAKIASERVINHRAGGEIKTRKNRASSKSFRLMFWLLFFALLIRNDSRAT